MTVLRDLCARAGHHHGRAPYGYDERMNVIEDQAAVIRRMFREYAVEGISQREIARRLNREGIGAQKGFWTQGAISKTLHMPAYVGKVRFNGEVYEGDHEPIIDPVTWQKAQQLRQSNLVAKRGKHPSGGHLLGGGLLRCGRCGGSMYAATRVREGRTTLEQYHCATQMRKGMDASAPEATVVVVLMLHREYREHRPRHEVRGPRVHGR